jgi:hypothetical protein
MQLEILQAGRHDLTVYPMPTEFENLFRDWAEGRVNFVEILDE